MTKEEFNELNVIDQFCHINNELKAGKKVDEIIKNIGMSDKQFRKFRKEKKYEYSQKMKQYIPSRYITQTTTESTTEPLEVSVVETNTNTLLTTEKANALDYLSNNINILMDIIERYRTTTESTTESTTNYITIDLIDDKHLKPKPKSIRINEFIYQEWQEFCDKQHYSKMDLISMALKEYMEKYK